jgi:hypothetical protein
MITANKAKHSRFSRLVTAILCLLIAVSVVCVVPVSASYYALDNWEFNSTWHGDDFDSIGNFTLTVSFGGVKLNNATNLGKFCFSIVDASNTGYTFEIYSGAGASLDYLSKDNTVYFKSLDEGAETLLYTSTDDAGAIKLTNDGETVEFYIDGVKVYQNTVVEFSATQFQYFTDCVPLQIGDITMPSCFTGAFSISLSNVSSGSVDADISGVTGMLLPLMIAMLPLVIYMAVFKLIPKMLRGIKL